MATAEYDIVAMVDIVRNGSRVVQGGKKLLMQVRNPKCMNVVMIKNVKAAEWQILMQRSGARESSNHLHYFSAILGIMNCLECRLLPLS